MEALASISGLRAIHSPPSAVPSTSTPSYTKLVPAKPGSSPGTCARSHPFQSPSRPSEPTPPDRLGERSGPACAKGAAPPVVPYNSVHTPPPTSKTEPSGSAAATAAAEAARCAAARPQGKWLRSGFRPGFGPGSGPGSGESTVLVLSTTEYGVVVLVCCYWRNCPGAIPYRRRKR